MFLAWVTPSLAQAVRRAPENWQPSSWILQHGGLLLNNTWTPPLLN